MPWTSLCEVDELVEGEGKYVEIDGFQLAVFLYEGNAYVIDNCCPHAGGNMVGSVVEEGCSVCPWHGWAFRLDNGQLMDSPAVNVAKYETRIIDGVVEADLPAP